MITLELKLPDGTLNQQSFEADSIVIGRSSKADLCVRDRAMSRRHARLYRDADAWLVEDLGSHNGTRLNDRLVEAPTPVGAGARLELGETSIRLPGERGPESSSMGHSVFRPAAELRIDPESAQLPATASAAEQQRYVAQLQLLNEVHQVLATTITLEELLDLIMDRIFAHFEPEEASVFLGAEDENVHCAASRSVHGSDADPCLHSAHLAREVMGRGQAALVLDAELDGRFNEAESLIHSGIRCLIAAPMPHPGGALGMIVVGSRLGSRQYNEGDMQLLASVAGVAALYLRNLRLAAEAAERERLEQEVVLAREIQLSLLPPSLPTVDGYQLRAGNIPSRGASGDFYKLVTRGARRQQLVVMLTDVSGKGIPAALLTASIEALSAPLIESGVDPASLCTQLSRLVFERTAKERFATTVVAELHQASGVLELASAGHNPCLLLHTEGPSEWLGATGIPIGILPGASYDVHRLQIHPGDTLLLYTDGITEAVNAADEEYGIHRFEKVAWRHRLDPLPVLANAIETDLDAFVGERAYEDDRTLVMLRRNP